MYIEKASPADAPRVMEIIDLCRQQMRAAGSDQWNDFYPRLEIVQEDANSGSLYVLRDDAVYAGAICLNEVQPLEYESLSWRYKGRALVVHRLCVRPDRQSTGAARMLMDFAEAFAPEAGYSVIRLDTYTGNARALSLYERRGYELAGQVTFPARKLPFVCLEKPVPTPSCSSAASSEQKQGTGADCPA